MSEKRTLGQEALRRLQNRTARLMRLIQMDAPSIIVVREAHLVAQAAQVLDPAEWWAAEARHFMNREKPRWGFCQTDGCENRVCADDPDLCDEHLKEEHALDAETTS